MRNFFDTYRAGLERLRAACDTGYLEGAYTSQWFEAKTDTPEREATLFMAYASDGGREKHVLIRRDLMSVPYFERVFLPRNGRTLILERIDPARPFYIPWISKPSEATDNLTPSDRRDVVARAAYSIGVGYLLPSILESPSFQIVEAGHVNRDGASFVRAAFKTQADPKASLPEMEGWLLHEPARDWALRSHEVRIALPASPKYHSVVSGTVLYADDVGSGPLPQEVNLVDRFTNEGRAGEHRIHFRARHRTAVAPPAADFTLAGYDLADYPWDTEARRDERGSGQLKVDPPILTYDRPAPETSVGLSFQLTNSGRDSVRVVGMRIGCAAIIPSEDLPCRMEAGQTRSFKLKLQATTETGASETRFPLYLYTTSQGQAEIVLTLVERGPGARERVASHSEPPMASSK